MFHHIIPKRFWSIAFATLFCVLGTTTFLAANAQDSDTNTVDIPTIEIPFNPELDEPSELPEDGEQIDSPLGENSRAIIGPDDRYPVLSRQYPWSAMGRLEWRDRGQTTTTCTATLIAPDAILTNSHCLKYLRYNSDIRDFDEYFLDSNQYRRLLSMDDGQSKMVFKPSLIQGQSLDAANVISFEAGWTAQYQNSADDWAVLKLDQPLGNFYGYLGWRYLDFTDPNVVSRAAEKIHLLGYAGDFPTPALRQHGNPSETAGIDLACSVIGVWPSGTPFAGTLAHDCDTNPGASGGPILAKFNDNKYYLVGLHAQSTRIPAATLPNGVTTNVINGGVQLSEWIDAALRARR